MPTLEHTYSYLGPSMVSEHDGRAEVSLATSGGRSPNPYFFTGFLGAPRQTAQALLVVAEVARTRYYEPPNMVAARIAAADPVVTSNVDRLRFESFSACAGVYARLDLEPGVLDGKPREWGTTNVDFNPPMRAALARVHDDEAMLMHVGLDEVRLTTLSGSAVEKKVPLPDRWLKGFAEVQVASAQMLLLHELPAVKGRRFLQSLPRTRSRSVAWAVPAGGGLRLSSRAGDAAVCLAGPERLGAYFHRELPYDRAALEKMHPRLLGARELVEQGAVTLSGDSATVRSGDAEYLVRIEGGVARCTCPWFARHRGERGPCKHVLAVEHARRVARVS